MYLATTDPTASEIARRALREARSLDRLLTEETTSPMSHAYQAVRLAERHAVLEALGNLWQDLTGEISSVPNLSDSAQACDPVEEVPS